MTPPKKYKPGPRIRGHEFTPDNTYQQGRTTKRGCKTCRRAADRAAKRWRKSPDTAP